MTKTTDFVARERLGSIAAVVAMAATARGARRVRGTLKCSETDSRPSQQVIHRQPDFVVGSVRPG